MIDNASETTVVSSDSYSNPDRGGRRGSGDIALILACSGSGTRATALAYRVLDELRDTSIVIDGRQRTILDGVDTISSVSGGSLTSAYYGLYGDRISEDFEDRFLKRNARSRSVTL